MDHVVAYLDLLKRCLTRFAFPDGTVNPDLTYSNTFDPVKRIVGSDWPARAETMIGFKRLENIEKCMLDVLTRNITGDFVECGVWRGGAAIFMRGVLRHAEPGSVRKVWVCDSFEGLPHPDPKYPYDQSDQHFRLNSYLAVSLEEVQANFESYGLLDSQVRFLKGWFEDTLPNCSIGPIAVLRADGDMYGSTTEILDNLYPKISNGGYLIVDDYLNRNTPGCRKAVDDFRHSNGITDKIETIDWTGVYWKKTGLQKAQAA